MKKQSDKKMVIMGSASLVQQFTRLDLLDEYILWLHPVILGCGKLLFKDIDYRRNFKLIRAKPYKNGVMKLILQPKK
jgi:dihydrofolate reductase